MPLDPQVVAMTKAIRQTESGGNFDAKGKSGEFGGYQYTNDTWDGASKKYGLNVTLDKATRQQQNEVTYKRIKDWKDSGNNIGQIASMWNAGEGRPNAYKENWKGVNQFGVAYDTPAYAKKVATAYQGFKPKTAEAAPVTPEPVEEKEPFSLKQLGKEIISPVTTMLARPFQAAQLGAETIRQKRETPELEANAKKYGDEAYSLAIQLKDMEEGPEKDKVKAAAESAQHLATYYTGRLSKDASYKPFSTDTLVAEAPESFADVKKDVGRGIQTAAFGLGPISGGAAFGTGMSLEEGNDLLSWDTLAYTAFGAIAGKGADLIGKPLLNAAGKVIGKITPATLKNVAAGGAKAVQAFMERNKLLPDAASKAVNVTAEALETGANVPFKAAAKPFRQNDAKVISAREKALQDLEEKYAQLRNNAARDPKATAATRARVARSNVLTEEGMVNNDGVIIGAKDAAKAYRAENIGEGESLVRKLLEREGVSVDIAAVERELTKVIKESFSGRELMSALSGIKREIAGLRAANRSGRISLVDLHDAKVSRQPGSKAYDNSESKALDKQIARAHKQAIEKNSNENIKSINKEIGKFLEDARYIESLNGKRIGSGKLGVAIATAGSAVAGAVAGGAVGGIPGAVVGSFAAKAAGKKLAGRGLKKALGKPTKTKPVKTKAFEEGKSRLKRKQLALPAGSAKTPIPVGPKKTGKGPVSVKAKKGEPGKDPKTGRFFPTYLSSKTPLPTSKVAKAAYKNTVANGGVTINLKGAMPTKGVAYAPYKGTERVYPKAQFSEKHVDKYVDDHIKELNKPGNHLGIWEDEGKIYLDVSKVGARTPKLMEEAIAAKQLGVFDLETFEDIALGKMQNGVYTRTYGKTANDTALNRGQIRDSNKKRSDKKPEKVSTSLREVSKQKSVIPSKNGALKNNPQSGMVNFGAMFGAGKKTMKPGQLISHEGAPDKLRVKYWKKKIQDGEKIKPLLVIKEGNRYGIEDGKHRFKAYSELGIKNIPVKITK